MTRSLGSMQQLGVDMAVTRRATTIWEGDLATGSGRLSAESSRAFESLPVSWAARTEQPGGKTSPEELLAAAHAACFSMAFSSELAKAGSRPESLEVTSEVTFDRVDGRWTVLSSQLTVHGRVAGLDAAAFTELAEKAKAGCPISRAIAGNVTVGVVAVLETSAVPARRP
jgi:lipoyl-dependent peroxiredoxin